MVETIVLTQMYSESSLKMAFVAKKRYDVKDNPAAMRSAMLVGVKDYVLILDPDVMRRGSLKIRHFDLSTYAFESESLRCSDNMAHYSYLLARLVSAVGTDPLFSNARKRPYSPALVERLATLDTDPLMHFAVAATNRAKEMLTNNSKEVTKRERELIQQNAELVYRIKKKARKKHKAEDVELKLLY